MPAPEDIYVRDVDFTALALRYPAFSKRLKSNRQLDFSDPESVMQLTKALLHRDFRLTIDLPSDRLCPPVPNRFNYILFAQKLLDATNLEVGNDSPSERLIGLDIGTGASAIYPLLACQQRSTWAFLATEIDEKSRSYAQRNITSNQLQSRIKLLDSDPLGKQLIPTSGLQRFDDYAIRIQITNPPFYASEDEMTKSAKQKARPPNSACTGAPIEMIVDGGETRFVTRLITESHLTVNRQKVQWFSSMLGKLTSVHVVIGQLKEAGCSNYAVTEFIQGQKTRRWCVAWSWHSIRPPTSIARGIPSLDKNMLPFPSDFDFTVADKSLPVITALIDQEMTRLDIEWWKPEGSSSDVVGIGKSMVGDVWSRKARRKKQHDHEMKDADQPSLSSQEEEPEPALVFRITIQVVPSSSSSSPDAKAVNVHVQWLQGRDAVLFESFCGWLKRKTQS